MDALRITTPTDPHAASVLAETPLLKEEREMQQDRARLAAACWPSHAVRLRERPAASLTDELTDNNATISLHARNNVLRATTRGCKFLVKHARLKLGTPAGIY